MMAHNRHDPAHPKDMPCALLVFPLGGEVGTCVDCGRQWTRAEHAAAKRLYEQRVLTRRRARRRREA
jgi:hypothetical protein